MRDLLNKLKDEVPWSTLVDVISQNVEQRLDATHEIVEQLKQWGAHLTSHALSKWSLAVVDPHPCQVPHVGPDEKLQRCRATAIVRCDSCGRWTCLAHCRVDYLADATCAVCIGEAKAHFRNARDHWETQKDTKRRERVSAAYRTLKLDEDATFAEVKRRYRSLMREHHADRPQSERERERNTRRMQKINEAFEVLKKHFEEAA
jgi:hypothetical protein